MANQRVLDGFGMPRQKSIGGTHTELEFGGIDGVLEKVGGPRPVAERLKPIEFERNLVRPGATNRISASPPTRPGRRPSSALHRCDRRR